MVFISLELSFGPIHFRAYFGFAGWFCFWWQVGTLDFINSSFRWGLFLFLFILGLSLHYFEVLSLHSFDYFGIPLRLLFLPTLFVLFCSFVFWSFLGLGFVYLCFVGSFVLRLVLGFLGLGF